jgi:hypothetical protein
MSTDGSRRARARARRARAFSVSVAAVIGVLAVLGLGGAALTTAQGPRITDVQVDPAASVSASGSRLILTTTQSLDEVEADQVTITPATDFTVDTSGRSLGIRFTQPLWDETEYTVRIDDVSGIGGGPSARLEESFRTPRLHVYLLQRGGAEDRIFRTDLDGDAAEPVFAAPHIEDFRATATHLVVSTLDDEGRSHLLATGLTGEGEHELPLPGEGTVTGLQSADRGNTIGYVYTDADVGTPGAIENALYTTSLDAARRDEPPTALTIAGGDSRTDDWRFVPGTDSILMLTFDGALRLVSPSGGDPVALGDALAVDGIARGSTVALVERLDGIYAIDLATAEERVLPPTDPGRGQVQSVIPLVGDTDRTLRVLAQLEGFDVLSTTVDVVEADGAARTVFTIDPGDIVLQTCVSPNGRYAAVLVAPDAVDNTYDGYLLPLPERLQTHVVSLEDGEEVVALAGFGISWCQGAPRG